MLWTYYLFGSTKYPKNFNRSNFTNLFTVPRTARGYLQPFNFFCKMIAKELLYFEGEIFDFTLKKQQFELANPGVKFYFSIEVGCHKPYNYNSEEKGWSLLRNNISRLHTLDVKGFLSWPDFKATYKLRIAELTWSIDKRPYTDDELYRYICLNFEQNYMVFDAEAHS